MWHEPIAFQWEKQSLFLGKISTSLCRSVNNSRPQTSESHRTINIEIQRADLLIQIIDLAKVTESLMICSPVVRSWLSCPYNVQVLQQRLGEGGRPLPAEFVAWCPHWCPSAPEHTTNTDTKSKALEFSFHNHFDTLHYTNTLMVLRLLIRLNKLISKYFICLQITHWWYSYKHK